MKKNIVIIIFALSIFSSCSYDVDKTEIFKVGKTIDYAFKKGDMEMLEQLYENSLMGTTVQETENFEKFRNFYTRNPILLKIDTTTHWIGEFSVDNLDLYYHYNNMFFLLRFNYAQNEYGEYFIYSFEKLIKFSEGSAEFEELQTLLN